MMTVLSSLKVCSVPPGWRSHHQAMASAPGIVWIHARTWPTVPIADWLSGATPRVPARRARSPLTTGEATPEIPLTPVIKVRTAGAWSAAVMTLTGCPAPAGK